MSITRDGDFGLAHVNPAQLLETTLALVWRWPSFRTKYSYSLMLEKATSSLPPFYCQAMARGFVGPKLPVIMKWGGSHQASRLPPRPPIKNARNKTKGAKFCRQ